MIGGCVAGCGVRFTCCELRVRGAGKGTAFGIRHSAFGNKKLVEGIWYRV